MALLVAHIGAIVGERENGDAMPRLLSHLLRSTPREFGVIRRAVARPPGQAKGAGDCASSAPDAGDLSHQFI